MAEARLPVAILAGGLATRLWPLTERLPKALIELNGEPFIAHQLRLLKARECTRVVICAGHLGEQLQAFVGDGARFGLGVAFSFDGPHLLGTAGAVRQAAALLGEAFFVMYGDSYLPCDYGAIQAAFRSAGKLALMAVLRNDDRWDRSNIEFVDGAIVRYDKRARTPRMHHIDYGLGVLSREALDLVPEGQPYDLERLYQDLLAEGQLAAFEVHHRFFEVGSWSGIQDLERHLSTDTAPALEAR